MAGVERMGWAVRRDEVIGSRSSRAWWARAGIIEQARHIPALGLSALEVLSSNIHKAYSFTFLVSLSLLLSEAFPFSYLSFFIVPS